MKPHPKTIVAFHFDEVVVPAKAGAVNTPGTTSAAHAGRRYVGMVVQFDALPKLILQLKLADGTIEVGEDSTATTTG